MSLHHRRLKNQSLVVGTLATLIFVGCASNPAPEAKPTPAPAPAPAAAAPAPAQEAHADHSAAATSAAPAEKHDMSAHHQQMMPAASASHGSGAHHREVGPVAADKALGWLKNGNTRFLKSKLRKDGQGMKDRERLAKGQKPHSIILSCADSRVPPELIFDQKLGEIFVVRAAGQALDNATLGSIEYAIEHLGSNLLVVMGHSSCGAVKAAHATLGGQDAGSPSLNKLVADIHPRIKTFQSKAVSKDALNEGWANVDGVARDLADRSEIIRNALDSGSLKIQKSLYHLDTGKVEWH